MSSSSASLSSSASPSPSSSLAASATATPGSSHSVALPVGASIGAVLVVALVALWCVHQRGAQAHRGSFFRRKALSTLFFELRVRCTNHRRSHRQHWGRAHDADTPAMVEAAVSEPTRPRRYGRRQDSGSSIRTIPSYSKDATDTELVLAQAEDSMVDISLEPISRTDSVAPSSDSDHAPPPDYAYRTVSEPAAPARAAKPRRTPFYRQFKHNRTSSTSLLAPGRSRSGSASTVADISAPLAGSFSRSSYVSYPAAGLSEAQMSFMASRESISLGRPRVSTEPPAFDTLLPPGAEDHSTTPGASTPS